MLSQRLSQTLGDKFTASGDFHSEARPLQSVFENYYDIECVRDLYHISGSDGKRVAAKLVANMPARNSWFYRGQLKKMWDGEFDELSSSYIRQLGADPQEIMQGFLHEHEDKWTEHVTNLVVNEGLDDNLTNYFTAVSPIYVPAFYVGLTDGTPTIAATDILGDQSPVKGWVEITDYLQSPDFRPDLVLGAVSGQSVDNTGSVAVFSINGTATIGGAIVVRVDNTKGGDLDSPQLGILYGAGAFTGGDRGVQNNDTLNVTVTLTAAGP